MNSSGIRTVLVGVALDGTRSTIRNTTISLPTGADGDGEVLVAAFGYTVTARHLDNSEEMVRERYSHVEAGELGDVATEPLDEVDRTVW